MRALQMRVGQSKIAIRKSKLQKLPRLDLPLVASLPALNRR